MENIKSMQGNYIYIVRSLLHTLKKIDEKYIHIPFGFLYSNICCVSNCLRVSYMPLYERICEEKFFLLRVKVSAE